MDELKDQEVQQEGTAEEFELTHTDKLVGVFTEPGSTFASMSRFPVKSVDWFLPLALTIIVAIISYFVIMSNPAVKLSQLETQMEAIEERLDDAVESGQMTEAQKEQQLEQTRDFMQNQQGMQAIFAVFGILIFVTIVFFLAAAVFLAGAKFGLKGEGTYKDAMAAYGLPYYILVLQVIVTVILSFTFDRYFQDTSVASLMDADTTTIAGWALAKLDVFSIWFYAVFGIGLSKMFKSDSAGKYLAMVFGIWLFFSLIFFFLKDFIPFT